ncbi:MAG: hypothetical protein LBK53_06900 [Heliobacteriaceae bacterium]|jgi:hypothetical protein|nr:hypothetical protein [Heliobacteriaceae bacterium]
MVQHVGGVSQIVAGGCVLDGYPAKVSKWGSNTVYEYKNGLNVKIVDKDGNQMILTADEFKKQIAESANINPDFKFKPAPQYPQYNTCPVSFSGGVADFFAKSAIERLERGGKAVVKATDSLPEHPVNNIIKDLFGGNNRKTVNHSINDLASGNTAKPVDDAVLTRSTRDTSDTPAFRSPDDLEDTFRITQKDDGLFGQNRFDSPAFRNPDDLEDTFGITQKNDGLFGQDRLDPSDFRNKSDPLSPYYESPSSFGNDPFNPFGF